MSLLIDNTVVLNSSIPHLRWTAILLLSCRYGMEYRALLSSKGLAGKNISAEKAITSSCYSSAAERVRMEPVAWHRGQHVLKFSRPTFGMAARIL